MIGFTEKGHKYQSLVPDDIQWLSTTSVISAIKEPFNQKEVAVRCSQRKPGKYPNKWYGISAEQIIELWNTEANRSTELGKWYHNKQEQALYDQPCSTVVKPVIVDGIKVAGDQVLQPGIYPEHMVYLESAGLCGQVDYVEVTRTNVLNLRDYKTNKDIKRKGFTNWEGITKKLLKPVQHLDDCELNCYALQLSIYAYVITRHNPMVTLGTLTIEHIKFEQEGETVYGYPIYKKDDNGEYVVKEIEYITVPYMKNEVVALITWMKDPMIRRTMYK